MKSHLLAWLASRDTGMSSRAILSWMERDLTVAALDGNQMQYPRDAADLGRCIRLMDIEPSYRERIDEMYVLGPEWARLVAHWSELETLYREEAPSGYAPKCTARMFELIHGRPLPAYPGSGDSRSG